MMKTMRAAVLVEPGRFDLREVSRPDPAPDEALIRIERTGICGTDMHIFHGNYAADSLPMIPGHEFAGRVVGFGQDVTGLHEGQPVVVDMNIGCGRCYWCRRNEVLNCPEMNQIGITMDGAFAEYIAVPARLVIPAPADTPMEILALTEPLACVVRAAKKAGIGLGASVLIIGAGPIGNLHVQLARTLGAAPVIASDISPERVEAALAAGADVGVHDPDGLKHAVLSATDGRGADIVIESVGHPALYAQAMDLMRKGGHLAAFGLTGPGETLAVDIVRTILEETSIKGSVAGMGEDMHDALTLLVHGRIDTRAFTGATYALVDIQDAFDTFADRPHHLKTQISMA
ncbi:MAG: alcohol dehydrogenase catalytic domain-containing protein [Silicimonas sp.]|nr:alcohol dehydrogenase catalytic domain-containing protein [Silicimonas sp.]